MIIGRDKNGYGLDYGDICKFKLKIEAIEKEYEGIICYDKESFAFAFEMKDNNFPMVLMHKACFGSIEKIINVNDTKNMDEYEFYRDIYYNKK